MDDKLELSETTVSSKIIYDGKIVRLHVDDITLPDGRPAKREVCDHPGGVGVLAVTGGNVMLVKQFRYPYKKELIEIPAGKLEPGEDPRVCGLRELKEETGLRREWKDGECYIPLGVIYPSPGYVGEIIHLYLAKNFEDGDCQLDDGEFLNLVKLPWDEFYRQVVEGEINDAKTVAACLRAERYIAKA